VSLGLDRNVFIHVAKQMTSILITWLTYKLHLLWWRLLPMHYFIQQHQPGKWAVMYWVIDFASVL